MKKVPWSFLPDFDEHFSDFILKDGIYKVELEVPGFGAEDLKIEVKNGILVIDGEKNNRKINYILKLPEHISSDIEANEYHGLLIISIKQSEEAKPKCIEVKSID